MPYLSHCQVSRSIGFSLLELLVVLALVITLIGLVTPSVAKSLDRQSQFAALHQLHSHLNRARMTAVSNQISVSACPSQTGSRCDAGNAWHLGWIVFQDPSHRGQPRHASDIMERSGATENVKITSGGRHRIRFRAEGTAYGSNATIRLCSELNPAPSDQIVISNPGRIRFVRAANLGFCDAT